MKHRWQSKIQALAGGALAGALFLCSTVSADEDYSSETYEVVVFGWHKRTPEHPKKEWHGYVAGINGKENPLGDKTEPIEGAVRGVFEFDYDTTYIEKGFGATGFEGDMCYTARGEITLKYTANCEGTHTDTMRQGGPECERRNYGSQEILYDADDDSPFDVITSIHAKQETTPPSGARNAGGSAGSSPRTSSARAFCWIGMPFACALTLRTRFCISRALRKA
jgi:hypothetical protein